jgi:eukaryotic-like serine/threonine-protein kinase
MEPCPSAGQLDRLLADRLDADECAGVSAHVQDCAACQETLEQLTRQDTEFPLARLTTTSIVIAGADATFVRRMESISPEATAGASSPERQIEDDVTVVTTTEGPRRITSTARPPVAVPGFEILGEVGRGGMAVVYKARQLSLKRLVALKMILAGEHVGPDRLARFRTEAEAVARLHHPGIVQIYETGEHGGVPYLALEFVAGGSLSQKMRDRGHGPRDAAALIETLADAIDAAHRAGIIHRDLTPSNILLAPPPGGGPGDDRAPRIAGYGVPKITDFGLAINLGEGSRHTRTGEVVGTPHYMAPEQAQGRRKEFGPPTDIHALGAILYELLTGRPPFIGATAVDTLVQVSYEDPIPPTRLRPDLPRDLEIICLKCLQKEPRQRYASARALAADLRRFLNGEAIQARPTSIGGRVIKWARRRPVIAALAMFSVVLTVVALASLSWALAQESDRRAQAEANERTETELRRQAQTERLRAERMSAAALLDQAVSQGDHGHIDRALLLLVQSLELAIQVGDSDLERTARLNLTAWRRHLIRQRATMTHPNWVWAVAYSPDGRTFVTASRDHTAQLWETATGSPVGERMKHDFPVWAVAFSPDRKTLVTASGEGPAGELRFWDAHSGQSLGPPLVTDQRARSVAFSPDGRTLLTVGSTKALLWKLEKGEGELNRPRGPAISLPHPKGVATAALSPDGTKVVTGGLDGTARLWAALVGTDLGVTLQHKPPEGPPNRFLNHVVAVAFSPDGQTIATGNQQIDAERQRFAGGEVRLWRVGGELLGDSLAHRGPIKTVAFSPDGRRALTGAIVPDAKVEDDFRGEARLWDVETGKQIGPTIDRSKPVWAVAFSPDGRTLMTGCEDGTTAFWVAATGLPVGPAAWEIGNVTSVAFAPDGRTALGSRTYEPATAKLWEVPPGRGAVLPPLHTGPVRHVAFAARGKVLLTAGNDGNLLRWDPVAGRSLGPPLRHQGAVNGLALSRDGAVAATSSADKTARTWDVVKGEPLGQPLAVGQAISGIALSPDASLVLTVEGPTLRRWDRASSQPLGEPLKHGWWATSFAFSPDGTIIATGGEDRTARLWDAATGRPLGVPLSHGGTIEALAFRPDGKLLATAGRDHLVRLWDVGTGKLLGKPMSHRQAATLAFSPDGMTLLSGSQSNTAWLFDVATGKPKFAPLQHRASVTGVFISPDGRTAATTSSDKSLRLWDMATGHQLGPPVQHPADIAAAAFHPNGEVIVTAAEDGLIRLWDVPAAAIGDAAAVRQWVETLTGMQLDGQGPTQELDSATVIKKRLELESAGPEPFPPSQRLP